MFSHWQMKTFPNTRLAIAGFSHYLKSWPDDVSIRLNLAVAYNQVGMYEAAEDAVDYVFAHKWRHFPDGMDVARNWTALMQNN